ncbi:MAG: type II toxin-antitoxin system Phd/YefM family antitoxin [bacterium]
MLEYILGVEEARKNLGDLITRVARKKQPVVITRRTKEKAVLINYEEYKKLEEMAESVAANEVSQALKRIRRSVADKGLPIGAVEEAIREVRAK